jgi:hypothetical protein
MACFSGFVWELPAISLEVFKISSIRKAICMLLVSNEHVGKIPLSGGDVSKTGVNKIGVNKISDSSFMFAGGDGSGNRIKSAGVSGLYGGGSRQSGSSGAATPSTHRVSSRSSGVSSTSMYFGVGSERSSGIPVQSSRGATNILTRAPVMSGLTTPSTMSPLFPPSNQSLSSHVTFNQSVNTHVSTPRVPSYQSLPSNYYNQSVNTFVSTPRVPSYEEFKKSINSDFSVRKEFDKDFDTTHKYKLVKYTVKWILRRRGSNKD